jgi:hypothetical protein
MRLKHQIFAIALAATAAFFPTLAEAEETSSDASLAGIEKPFLWKIERPTPAHVFGTIHIPDARLQTLPPIVEEAFSQADAVRTEVGMGAAEAPALQLGMMLPPGETLEKKIPAELYEDLQAVLTEKGVPAPMARMLNAFKPWAAGAALAAMGYAENLSAPPLDMLISTRAAEAGKDIAGLETVEEHLAVFDESLSDEEQVEFLRLAILETREPETSPEKMLDLYLAGDLEGVSAEIRKAFDHDHPLAPKLRRVIISDRDARFADRIESLLNNNPDTSYFFAIGAGHLADEGNVLELLREKGFAITRAENAHAESAPETSEQTAAAE